MYVYIHNPSPLHSHFVGEGKQKHTRYKRKKITWPGKVCGRYPFDTFEGVVHCA